MFGSPSDESSFYEEISIKLSDIGAARSSVHLNKGENRSSSVDYNQPLNKIERSHEGVKHLIESEQQKRSALMGSHAEVHFIFIKYSKISLNYL